MSPQKRPSVNLLHADVHKHVARYAKYTHCELCKQRLIPGKVLRIGGYWFRMIITCDSSSCWDEARVQLALEGPRPSRYVGR